MERAENLSDYTTLRLGGPAKQLIHARTEDELIAAVTSADEAGEQVLILGGGSNILVSDDGFDGTVIRVETSGNSYEFDACSGGMIQVAAGEDWDGFVQFILSKGWAGLESMSGIPGTVGAAPIQNIGAYGHEVSEAIARVRTYDRETKSIKTFTGNECGFGYRTSMFKQTPDRYVILDVTFQLRKGIDSLPIQYKELVDTLGVEIGTRVNVHKVRDAVLLLRNKKGMLLTGSNANNSAGSFFTNPVISAERALTLPDAAPRWIQQDGRVKTSAAWLIENSGIIKGHKHGGASVSDLHVLALTNSGDSTTLELAQLARLIQESVRSKFAIELEPEVRLIGLAL